MKTVADYEIRDGGSFKGLTYALKNTGATDFAPDNKGRILLFHSRNAGQKAQVGRIVIKNGSLADRALRVISNHCQQSRGDS